MNPVELATEIGKHGPAGMLIFGGIMGGTSAADWAPEGYVGSVSKVCFWMLVAGAVLAFVGSVKALIQPSRPQELPTD